MLIRFRWLHCIGAILIITAFTGTGFGKQLIVQNDSGIYIEKKSLKPGITNAVTPVTDIPIIQKAKTPVSLYSSVSLSLWQNGILPVGGEINGIYRTSKSNKRYNIYFGGCNGEKYLSGYSNYQKGIYYYTGVCELHDLTKKTFLLYGIEYGFYNYEYRNYSYSLAKTYSGFSLVLGFGLMVNENSLYPGMFLVSYSISDPHLNMGLKLSFGLKFS
ncbi:MAG: hypothetical protein WC955_08165 [Elusimicrobiota bacterium]